MEWQAELRSWAEIWEAVSDLRHLQTLRLWFDHSNVIRHYEGPNSFEMFEWAAIHEKNLLSRLLFTGEPRLSPTVHLTYQSWRRGMERPDEHHSDSTQSLALLLACREDDRSICWRVFHGRVDCRESRSRRGKNIGTAEREYVECKS